MEQVSQTSLVVFWARLYSRNAQEYTVHMFPGAPPSFRISATKDRIVLAFFAGGCRVFLYRDCLDATDWRKYAFASFMPKGMVAFVGGPSSMILRA